MTKALHWLIFVIVAAQLAVGFLTRIDDAYYASIPGLSEERLFGVHLSLGALSCSWPSSASPGGC